MFVYSIIHPYNPNLKRVIHFELLFSSTRAVTDRDEIKTAEKTTVFFLKKKQNSEIAHWLTGKPTHFESRTRFFNIAV